mmetsp:Transcript_42053/g.85007  ORF Transcript_42053/g.85007 Transcript_42053/m.85007 type:complete len:96 (+) Transcript_42053:953-1240(+)
MLTVFAVIVVVVVVVYRRSFKSRRLLFVPSRTATLFAVLVLQPVSGGLFLSGRPFPSGGGLLMMPKFAPLRLVIVVMVVVNVVVWRLDLFQVLEV